MRTTKLYVFSAIFILAACASKQAPVPQALSASVSSAEHAQHEAASAPAIKVQESPQIDPQAHSENHAAASASLSRNEQTKTATMEKNVPPAKVEAPAKASDPLTHHSAPTTGVQHSTDATHSKSASTSSVSASLGLKQLQWLKNGNARFVKNHQRNEFKKLADKKSLISKLSAGQKPHSIILSCSDSQVPPELVFDQVMGEIFVIRVAGEALDSSVVASIEYAAEHLGTELIVVMGHESCGAVKAAFSTPEGKTAGSPNLDRLVADIRPRIFQSARMPASASANFHDEAWWNAKGVARDLLSRSPVLAELSHQGKIKIVSALYEINSGVVDFE